MKWVIGAAFVVSGSAFGLAVMVGLYLAAARLESWLYRRSRAKIRAAQRAHDARLAQERLRAIRGP